MSKITRRGRKAQGLWSRFPFTLHGTAAFVPILVLTGLGLWIHAAHAAHERHKAEERLARRLLSRKH